MSERALEDATESVCALPLTAQSVRPEPVAGRTARKDDPQNALPFALSLSKGEQPGKTIPKNALPFALSLSKGEQPGKTIP